MKKVLITGAAGYIGEILSRYLLEKEYDIYTYADMKYGCYVEKLKGLNSYNCIVHLAAISGIQNCEDNFEQAVKSNIIATHHIFKEATKNGVRTIFTSSQAAKTPFDSFYATSKKIAEELAIKFNKKGGNNIVLRLTNVYGGFGYMKKKDTVVKRFIEKHRNNEDIIIDGDGLQTRDFLNVYDVCRAIHLAIETDKVILEPIDIGTGVETSILDLAKMLGDKFTFNEKSDRIGVNSGTADIEKAKEILGFEYKEKIEDYMKKRKVK